MAQDSSGSPRRVRPRRRVVPAPISVDWLPDGRMLVVEGPSARLLRREPGGSLVTHADLRGSARASAEGGEALEAVELDRGGFSCALGGPDGRSLFVLAAEFHGFETMAEDIAARTGQLLVVHGRVPRAGRP